MKKGHRGGALVAFSLLDLDSNQEPTGYTLAPVSSLTERITDRDQADVETDAVVTTMFRAFGA